MKNFVYIIKFFFTLIIILGFYRNSIAQFSKLNIDIGLKYSHETPILMGGGAAFFDFNQDGFLDIYMTGGGKADNLLINSGKNSFLDISMVSNIDSLTKNVYTTGVIVGDINNDGCIDLFITTFDEKEENLLFVNNCNGTYSYASENAGITQTSQSMGAIFLDVNNDALLDIYVINYLKKSDYILDDNDKIVGYNHTGYSNFLYINIGDNKFVESSDQYMVKDNGCGLAVISTDFDNNNSTDIYIANDYGEWVIPNGAYKNLFPDIGFDNVSTESKLDVGVYGMGIASGDYDLDGDMDYYISNLGRNVLLDNQNNYFVDLTTSALVENTFTEDGSYSTSWGTFFFDYDNDIDLDLFVSNGYITSAEFLPTNENDPNKLYSNNGDGTFDDISLSSGIEDVDINRGAIYGDYDNDGDLDLLVVSIEKERANKYSSIYRNELNNSHNWLKVKLEGTNMNYSAIGAKLLLFVNGIKLIKEIYSGGTHASQSSLIAHFGLKNNAIVDSLIVNWQGQLETFYDIPINQMIYIKEASKSYEILGCTDNSSSNYNPLATKNYGCSNIEYILGCTDIEATNYNELANYEDSSCKYKKKEVIVITGINQVESDINVFPTLFSHTITVDNSISSLYMNVEISDLSGNIIFSKSNWSDSKLIIDTSDFHTGMYLCIIKSTSHPRIVRKIFKSSH